MFRTVLSETPFTSSAANVCFPNIKGGSYQGDFSFLASLRALVAPRMSEDEKLTLSFSSSAYTRNTIERCGNERVFNAITEELPNINNHGMVHIHTFTASLQESRHECMEIVKSRFCDKYSGWEMIPKFTDFYRKSFYTLCFINQKNKSVVLFVDDLDVRRMHYLQCSIFAFLPWYFDVENGVTNIEMQLIQSLREKTPNNYKKTLEKMAEAYDFRTVALKQMLYGFEDRFIYREIEDVKDKIERLVNQINEYNNQIGRYLKEKNDRDTMLIGLEAKLAQNDGESEILDYFIHNKNITLDNVSESTMTFSCKGYVTYFDEDMAKRMIDNPHSYVYRVHGDSYNHIIKAEDMKKLMYALFVDQTIKMKVCAAYSFDLRGNVSGISHYNFDYTFSDCMPNPHIDRYRCLGNHLKVINEALESNDYITAIEQCVASCKSLSFGDSTVMTEFMSRIYGISDDPVNVRCIELPDGRIVEPKEAIDWIHEQETEIETETTEEE